MTRDGLGETSKDFRDTPATTEGRSYVRSTDNYGRTPLHLAARAEVKKFVRLSSSRPDIHAKDQKGCTPFHRAARRKGDTWECCEILLKAGADARAKDKMVGLLYI